MNIGVLWSRTDTEEGQRYHIGSSDLEVLSQPRYHVQPVFSFIRPDKYTGSQRHAPPAQMCLTHSQWLSCNSGCHLWLSRWPSSLKVKVKLPCMLSNFGFLFNSWLDNTWSPLTYIYWKRCSFLLLLCFCHFTFNFNFVLILFSVLGTLVKGF